MKFRNIILVLRDQMPLGRLWRNFRLGNLRGIWSMRSHLNNDGRKKIAYSSRESSGRAAMKMREKYGHEYRNYKCLHCDGYHIGKNRSSWTIV